MKNPLFASLLLALALPLAAAPLAAAAPPAALQPFSPSALQSFPSSLITSSDWRMTDGNDTSLYKFYPDSTWEESWKGEFKEGRWKQTGGESFSIGAYTFQIENDGAQLRRNDGRIWKRAPATPGRLAPPVPTPEEMRARILTPPPPDTPRINGPRVFGARPGSIFLYTVPATGKRPMTFSAGNLPPGLKLDPETGRITGSVATAGDYKVTLRATNALGSSTRDFIIKIGGKLALTPPLGWSSWNAYGSAVSQEKTLAIARAMAATGLVNHGYSYINIDATWPGERGGKYNAIQPNSKFPDMQKLADEIHALGLKLGIYSSPWIGTYIGHIGSYADNADGTHDWIKQGKRTAHYRYDNGNPSQDERTHYRHGKYSFVKNDVAQWTEWGVDYLKYDWNPNDYYHTKEMHDALRATNRDIIYSLSVAVPWADAPRWAELCNLYRTTGDIRDTWKKVCDLGFSQTKWAAFSGPGHWADPDMLVVGRTGGWAGGASSLHYTRLTADEQYTHISLWALLSAPLLIGCDLTVIDDFTLSLLTNDEVLDIDQDPLGLPAMPVVEKGDTVVYAKHLWDGALAVGLFNKGDAPCEAGFTLRQLGLRGTQTIRDLWRQKDIATTTDTFAAPVNPHGVLLLKISPGNPTDK
jgi:alpha-galactosidase